MKKSMNILAFIAIFTLLSGCTNREVDTSVGAAAGAGLGYAVGHNAVGAIIGAGAGALIGNEISKNH